MKLIKYFFTIPFNPKQEWKKAIGEMDASKNIKEDAIAVFLLMTILSIGYSYVFDWYRGDGYFSIESALTQYFRLILTTIGAVVGIRMVGGMYHLKNMESTKLFVIFILASGLIDLLSNLVFFYFEYHMMYSFLWYYFLHAIIYIVIAFYVVLGLMPNYEIHFKEKELSKNLPGVFFIAVVLFAVDVLYNFAYAFVYGFFYSLF